MPAAARRRGPGGGQEEGGEEGTRAAGRDPWKPSDVTGPRRPARAAARFLPPPPAPRPARAEGPRVSPAPARRPLGASCPGAPSRRVFTGSRAGVRRLRAGPATGPATLGELGAVGVLGRGGGSAAHTRGRTEGCWSPRRPDARAEVRGHPATTRRVLSNQRQWGSPLPPSHLGPTLDSQGSAPWALHSPSLLRFALEGPAASQSSQLGLPRGLGVEANRGEGRAAPPPGGEGSALLRRARPPGMPCSWRPSAASAGDVLGLLPSAFGDLPSSNSHEPWGETAASEPRSGLLDPRRETGTTPEAREAHLRSRW